MTNLRCGKTIAVLFFILLQGLIVFAQEQTVSGKVTDQQTGVGLPGVTIAVRGTTRSTTTGNDGAFSISASSTDVLEFTFTGYASQEITVGNNTNLSVTMGPS